MKVSEKSLELNIGAELLGLMRNSWGMPKAYLRGLTQAEERQEGVDLFVQLNPKARIFAFQFKAPHGKTESVPYKYTLVKYQHDPLFQLSQYSPRGVFYVFPYYVTFKKLQKNVPTLMMDTWFLDVRQMEPPKLFGNFNTRTIRCSNGTAAVNPEYQLERLHDMYFNLEEAVPARIFADWYGTFRRRRIAVEKRGNPWLVRGLRVAIVEPSA
jgi:hypothetical protein